MVEEPFISLPTMEANRAVCPRLNPRDLRSAGRYFASDSEPESVPGVAARTFWECEAEYNPLGQFGASFRRDPRGRAARTATAERETPCRMLVAVEGFEPPTQRI